MGNTNDEPSFQQRILTMCPRREQGWAPKKRVGSGEERNKQGEGCYHIERLVPIWAMGGNVLADVYETSHKTHTHTHTHTRFWPLGSLEADCAVVGSPLQRRFCSGIDCLSICLLVFVSLQTVRGSLMYY